MKYILLLGVCLLARLLSAQPTLTVTQTGGHRDKYVFYKSGNEDVKGKAINDSTMRYIIPVTEPFRVMIVDDSTRRIKTIWVDSRYRANRNITLDNRTLTLIRHDTLPYDLEEESLSKIQDDYIEHRISTSDSFSYFYGKHMKDYIIAHPDSFLAAYYLHSIISDFDEAAAIRYRSLIPERNRHYSFWESYRQLHQKYEVQSRAECRGHLL